jgi:ABC-2 type transport system ATP-binding protein
MELDTGRRTRRRRAPSTTTTAIALHGLWKRFGAKVAVGGVELEVPHGSFFGLVGPNGAGKTTTLRMATGLLRPDAGQVVVDGIDVWREPLQAKAAMGVLPEDVPLFDRLTGRQLLTYNGLLRSMDTGVIARRSEELLDVLGLTDAGDTMVIDYSQGMRKKIGLACALLHAPRVLFLDEPFESVDPVSARTIREVLGHVTESGGTIVFSSHVMELVERLCDRLAIMHRGQVVAQGTMAAVSQGRPLDETFVQLVGAQPDASGKLEWLSPSSWSD